jgi:Membrane-fusion protein
VRRRTLAIAGTGLLALAAAAVALGVTGAAGGGTGSAAPAAAAVPATAEIERQDLVDTKTVDGALTYADERRVASYASGTVTWVPEEGATIRRGRPLLRVDRDPVVLMYGSLPLYRPLYWGVSDGPDVAQLERNLKALGYGDDLTVDNHFSYATHQAVLAWQDDRGLPETGRVDAAQVVFLPGAVRVTEAKVAVGDRIAPGRPALTVTGTDRVVQVKLDTDDQHLVRKGDKVTVELPGGERMPGTVTSVGTVAKTSGREEDGETTIDVEITLRKRPKTRLDRAPVEVELVSERVRNVLTVPVEALLALREGGFGVEVVEGSATRIVPVEIGAFGSGRVEIKGAGLAEGMKVGVPAS